MAHDSGIQLPAIRTVVLTVVFAFGAGPPIYYSVIDVIRRRHVRKRRARYSQRTGQREPFSDDTANLTCSEQERKEALKELFASYKIGNRFSNPFVEWREQSFWEVLVWKLIYTPLSGRFLYQGGKPSDPELLRASLPIDRPNFVKLFGLDRAKSKDRPNSSKARSLTESWDQLSEAKESSTSSSDEDDKAVHVSDDLTFTWIGQSTCYVQLEGVSILTDPIFDERTLPTVLAPKRLCSVPCQLKELLPALDVVLCSHNHPDHISISAIRTIGNRAKWIVPLGVGKLLASQGVTNYTEMDWWQETELEVARNDGTKRKVTVCCTPSMHWSARGLFDSNLTLWASFVVKGNKNSFFHVGDTGYSEVYKAIGEIHGPMTLSAIPIGAYEPRWHLRTHHTSPWDALVLHHDIRSQRSIGVHWGSWVLSDEFYLNPPKDLETAKQEREVEGSFEVVRPGQTMIWELE